MKYIDRLKEKDLKDLFSEVIERNFTSDNIIILNVAVDPYNRERMYVDYRVPDYNLEMVDKCIALNDYNVPMLKKKGILWKYDVEDNRAFYRWMIEKFGKDYVYDYFCFKADVPEMEWELKNRD